VPQAVYHGRHSQTERAEKMRGTRDEVKNVAGETVFIGLSIAECVRWYEENGRPGDYLADTGERMSEVAADLGLDK
jgi:hypothetical protein